MPERHASAATGLPERPWLAAAARQVADAYGSLGGREAAHLGIAPPNQAAYGLALDVIEAAAVVDLPPVEIRVCAEEGISFLFSRGERDAYVECYNTGAMAAATDDRVRRDIQAWDFSPADLIETSGWVKGFLGG